MIQDVFDKNRAYLDDVCSWSATQYERYFSKYFNMQAHLAGVFQSAQGHVELTDEELTDVLTKIPLDLILASAQLSEFKTSREVIKMRIKQQQQEFIDQHKADGTLSMSALKEAAADLVIEDKLVVTVYDGIIERVEKEISYSKELIMGCKKIWDGRRNAEGPMLGLDGSENTLAEYDFATTATPAKPKTYIT